MSNSNSASRINFDAQLAEHANEIRRLGKRAVADIIEIGKRLIAAKQLCGHGNWLSWLEREFGWAERTARNFMSAAELAAKSAIVADLNIDLGALYRLAAPSTPAEVVAKVVARGERARRLPTRSSPKHRPRVGRHPRSRLCTRRSPIDVRSKPWC